MAKDGPVQRRGGLTPVAARMVSAAAEIMAEAPDKADFLHTVLCQVGMPRKRTEGRTFTRTNGGIALEIEAGKLWDGRYWREQPLPYGTKPRLVMVHISSEAVRTRTREVEVGHSIRGFLETLGIGTSGGKTGPFSAFKTQMAALAACRMTMGLSAGGRVRTVDAKPIEQFDAWLHPTGAQRTLWPGTMTLSSRFFETLLEHAVPLDKRALAALQHSALALDAYTWLAHRLCRIERPEGVKVSWQNLRDQFGDEYANQRDFKHELRRALSAALAVYPSARVEDEPGGIRLLPSPPPVPRTQVLLASSEESSLGMSRVVHA
jgi:Plasmid encoded RepA protein